MAGTQRSRNVGEEVELQSFLRLPYVPGLEKHFERLARRLDVRVRYTRGRTLGSLVRKAKLDKV